MSEYNLDENLTNENYHEEYGRKNYMGFSQFKNFEECEVMAMAMINGEYEKPKTDSLLYGSWVDAHFSEEEAEFIEKNKDSLYSPKTGKIYAAFNGVETTIAFIENYENDEGDHILARYWGGEHQVIMTGEIAGVPVKIKIDSFFPGKAIVDGKVMKDLEPVWVERDGHNMKLNYIEAYEYMLEGALYQAIVEQRTGDKLPFILNVVTKETPPNAELVKIDQFMLDVALERFKEKAPRYQRIKMGLEKPIGCGKCPICVAKKQIYAPQPYTKLYPDEKEK